MIIDLKTIQHGSRTYEINLGKEWWKQGELENEPIIGLDKPLSVKVKIYRAGKRFILEGSLHGSFKMVCDRCLESFTRDVEHEFNIFLEVPSQSKDVCEVELMEEDMEVGFINNDEIEINDIIREQIFLSQPIKSLCREDCLGLCTVCGANRNENRCDCDAKSGHPAFSILEKIEIKGE